MESDPGAFVIVILISCALFGPCLLAILYFLSYAISFWPTSPASESQLNELQLDTRVGCPNGLCYLPMFETRYHDRILAELGHFPTIIALASIAKSYRRKVKGKLTLIGDGVAHLERDKKERMVWEIVEGLIGRLEFIGSREMRVFSSTPPEGYHYLELFLPECRNLVLQLLGPFPPLQAVVRINVEYRTEFIGVLWQKETDRYVLEKELNVDVWAQLGRCVIRPEATIN